MKPIAKSLIMLAALFTINNAVAKEDATLASSITFKDAGTGLVELIYNGSIQGQLTVEIFGKKSKPLFKEVIKNQEKFKKPYNLKQLPYGAYTIRVSTKDENVEHKVNYSAPEFPGKVKVMVETRKEDAFRYLVFGPEEKDLKLFIYDDQDRILHREAIKTEANFGKIYSFRGTDTENLQFILIKDGEVINEQKVRLQ